MALALDDDGNILFDPNTGLSLQRTGKPALEQDARAECRCEQGTYFVDIYYGRNPLVWKLSQVESDRVSDIRRIVEKYYIPQSIGPGPDGEIVVT